MVWVLNLLKLISFFCLFVSLVQAKVSSLADRPDWSELNEFQKKWTKEQFESTLRNLYCPRESWWKPWIDLDENHVRIKKANEKDAWYKLNFADSDTEVPNEVSFPTSLKKMKIALDPGHLGGAFSEMEGRHFSIGNDKPVKEGDLTLEVALKTKVLLEAEGAEVFVTRNVGEPVTEKREWDFMVEAESWISQRSLNPPFTSSAEREKMIRKRREMLFYRVSEIYARSTLLQERFQPDLTICIHLNAAPWRDPDNPQLVERNDYHVLVNGCYMGGELAYENQRFEMLKRLLNGWGKFEQKSAESMALAFSEVTKLPAFVYKGPNALKIGKVDGVWARNLLANRIYPGPVIFLEPYVANSVEVYHRLRPEYDKETNKSINRLLPPLTDEYAQAILLGIKSMFQELQPSTISSGNLPP